MQSMAYALAGYVMKNIEVTTNYVDVRSLVMEELLWFSFSRFFRFCTTIF
jgi:hypothetical protein